jgi:hypothetical protein
MSVFIYLALNFSFSFDIWLEAKARIGNKAESSYETSGGVVSE